ncbi:MAG: hypothetical protein ACREQI_01330 [Candidatus Binataceae bacterium]
MSGSKENMSATEWVTEPKDKDDAETREVYAHAGLALYLAQCLEHGIVNSLVLAQMEELHAKLPAARGRITDYKADMDRLWNEEFQKTFGQLINSLSSTGIKIPRSLESDLRESLRLRNQLVHHYFRDRADSWFSSDGRRSMAEELKAMREHFVKTDRTLHEVTSNIRAHFGMTDEKIDFIAELMKIGTSEEDIERAIAKAKVCK